MKPADRKTFVEIVVGFAELKGKSLSAAALELFWRAMQHWAIEDFQDAANHLIRTCEFMPTPKDFEALRKAGRMTTGEAWALAKSPHCEGPRNPITGAYASATSGDAIVDKCVHMIGGYSAISMCDVDKLGFLERRFCEHYEALRDANDTRQAVPQIASRDVGLTQLKRGLLERKKA